MQDLHKLRQLDGIDVSKTEKLEAGFQVSSSEEEDYDEDNNEEYDPRDEPDRQSIADGEGIIPSIYILIN